MLSITATELPRFLACNGFASMGIQPPVEQDEQMRLEGNSAHWLVQYCLQNNMHPDEMIDRKSPDGIYITPQMVEHVETYYNDLKSSNSAVEVNTSIQHTSFEIRGRADAVILEGNTLIIPDFKYGWKIVEPDNNWTLMSHAFGWMFQNTNIRIDEIKLKIYQPRPFHPRGNVREWSITAEEIWKLWNYYLVPRLSKNNGMLNTGSHCYKCPAMSNCPAQQIALMSAFDVSERAYNSIVDNTKLAMLIDESEKAMEIIKQNLKAYEDLALHRIKSGQNVPNYSVQTSKGQRAWLSHITADFLQLVTGIDASKKELKTPKQAENMGVHKDIVESFTVRPTTGVKLVRVDAAKQAEKMFGKKGN